MIQDAYRRRLPYFAISSLATQISYLFLLSIAGILGGNQYLNLIEICLSPPLLTKMLLSVFGLGARILFSNSIGAGNLKRCGELYTLLMTRLLLLACAMALAGIALAAPLTRLFSGGASPELLDEATRAVRVLMLFVVPNYLTDVLRSVLDVYGCSRETALIEAGALAAAVLGLVGSRAAGVMLPFTGVLVIIALWQLVRLAAFLVLKHVRRIPLAIGRCGRPLADTRELIRCGFPQAADDLFDELSLILINRLLVRYLGDNGLGCYAAVESAALFLWFPFAAGAQGAVPLLSALLGMRDRKNIEELTALSLQISYTFGLLLNVAVLLTSNTLTRLLGYTGGEGAEVVCMGIRIYCLFMPCYGLIIWLSQYYAALRHPFLSFLVSAAPDTVVFPLMAALLMPRMQDKYLACFLSYAGCYGVCVAAYLLVQFGRTHSLRRSLRCLFLVSREISDEEVFFRTLPAHPTSASNEPEWIYGLLTVGGAGGTNAQNYGGGRAGNGTQYYGGGQAGNNAQYYGGSGRAGNGTQYYGGRAGNGMQYYGGGLPGHNELPAHGGLPERSARLAAEILSKVLRDYGGEIYHSRKPLPDAEVRIFTNGQAWWIELIYGLTRHRGYDALTFPEEMDGRLSYCYLYDFNLLRINLPCPGETATPRRA